MFSIGDKSRLEESQFINTQTREIEKRLEKTLLGRALGNGVPMQPFHFRYDTDITAEYWQIQILIRYNMSPNGVAFSSFCRSSGFE